MSAILVKMPPGDAQRGGAQRLADGEADEAGPRVVARNEQQDAQHQQQLDADEEHADAHPRAQRDGVNREGFAAQAGERGPRVGEGVHADAEPGDAVAPADADQAEDQDDDHPERLVVLQHAEVQHHRRADEHLEDEDELPLRDQIRLAGFVDEFRNLQHRRVHRQVLEAGERHEPEEQAQHADDQTGAEQRAPVDAVKLHRRQIRQLQVRFTARLRRAGRLRHRLAFRLRGLRGRRARRDRQRHQYQERRNGTHQEPIDSRPHLTSQKIRIIPGSRRPVCCDRGRSMPRNVGGNAMPPVRKIRMPSSTAMSG